MAYVDWTTSISGTVQEGNYNVAADDGRRFAIKKRYIDCATYNMASGSYYKIMDVPANTIVRTYIFVGTVEGGTATVDLCWVADTDTTPSSAVALMDDQTIETDDTCAAGTVYANDVDGSLVILANEALDAAKFWIVAEMLQLATTD